MSRQSYYPITLYASARRPRGVITGASDFTNNDPTYQAQKRARINAKSFYNGSHPYEGPTEPAYKFEGGLSGSSKIDIVKSGDGESPSLILSYAWGQLCWENDRVGPLKTPNMSDLVLEFTDRVQFKDNINLTDERVLPRTVLDANGNHPTLRVLDNMSGNVTQEDIFEDRGEDITINNSGITNNEIRIPLIPDTRTSTYNSDKINDGDGDSWTFSSFFTKMDMVLPLESFNSGSVSYKLTHSNKNVNGVAEVLTGEDMAVFGMHMQVTGTDLQR